MATIQWKSVTKAAMSQPSGNWGLRSGTPCNTEQETFEPANGSSDNEPAPSVRGSGNSVKCSWEA